MKFELRPRHAKAPKWALKLVRSAKNSQKMQKMAISGPKGLTSGVNFGVFSFISG